ncbi:MAG: tetratricopeptide repeat protein [Vicinamibacterales bacterium]
MTADARGRVLRRADALARVGRAGDARDCLLALVDQSPSDWSAVQAAAELCARTGRSADAVRLYLGMARHFARQGATARAEQLYDEVRRLDPGDRAAAFRQAELAAARGDHAGARALLAGTAPGDEAPDGDALPGLRLAARAEDVLAGLAAGRFDDARQALVRLVAKARGVDPGLTEAWLAAATRAPERLSGLATALADVCLVAGDPDAAIRTLREFLVRVPGDAVALQHLVGVAAEAGAGAVAIEAQAALVDALVHLGRLDDARAVAEDLVARLPDAANRERLTRVTAALASGSGAPAPVQPPGPATGTPSAAGGVIGGPPESDRGVRDLSDALEALGTP